MSFSTNLKGAMIHARRWIPSNTKKRISSIRSSIPKASKTLFGKRSKRAKRTIAYKLSTANITSLCNFRKLSIFLFALVWYRCLAARLFEIFHHFGYLKSKYPESIANPFPPLLWRLEPEEHRRYYYNQNLLLHALLHTRGSSIIVLRSFDNFQVFEERLARMDTFSSNVERKFKIIQKKESSIRDPQTKSFIRSTKYTKMKSCVWQYQRIDENDLSHSPSHKIEVALSLFYQENEKLQVLLCITRASLNYIRRGNISRGKSRV